VRRLSWVLVLIVLASTAKADEPPQPGVALGATPREQALRLYAQATKMFGDEDWIAAAVTFGQAQVILARVDRNPDGSVIDEEAHTVRNAALSNKATSYARAGLFVEGYNAFVELRDEFGKELSQVDREEVDEAIARMGERIGTVKLSGLPDEELEVRFDGRLERRDPRQPLRMSEGDHSIDIKAAGWKPYIEEITVVRQQELALVVKLEPLKTPAKVRIESSVGSSQVEIDGTARGAAPVEVSLAPGKHRVVVSSESYLSQTSELELKPNERAILRVGMVRARAPLGLRLTPSFLASFPLRGDTPFGSFASGVALQLYHDSFRIRTLRFGLGFEYHPRKLNSVGLGVVGTWCPDMFASASGKLAWCPATGSVSYVFGDREDQFDSGQASARLVTALELRRGSGFARVAAGVTVEDYRRTFPESGIGDLILILWSSVIEVSVGLDL